MASVVEGASQLTQGSWGRAGGALALGVICHLALEGTEISVSVQPSLAPLSQEDQSVPSLLTSVHLLQPSLLPDVTPC